MKRVAIIGVTGYASVHLSLLRAFAAQGKLQLVAVTAINRLQAEETCRALEAEGCVVHPDYRSMLAAHAGRIDLCIVPTSPHLHAEMTVAALEAGANVLLEKPLAPTLVDIEAILAAERRTGRWVAVGFQDFYAPELTALRDRVAAGEWGRLRSVSTLGFWPRPFSYYARNSWAGKLHADGQPVFDSPLSNAMAHFAMTMLRLAAPAGSDVAELTDLHAELSRAYPIESFDTILLRARTPEGADFRFCGTHACPHFRPVEILVRTELARITWRHETSLVIEHATGVESLPITDSAGAREKQLEAVLRRLDAPATPICTTRIGAAHARLYIGLHRDITIADAPPETVIREERDGQAWLWVRGLEDRLAAAHRG